MSSFSYATVAQGNGGSGYLGEDDGRVEEEEEVVHSSAKGKGKQKASTASNPSENGDAHMNEDQNVPVNDVCCHSSPAGAG